MVENKDKKIILAVISTQVLLMIQFYLLYSLNITDTLIGNKVQIGTKLFVGIFIIFAIKDFLKHRIMLSIQVSLIILIILSINFLGFPENRKFLSDVSIYILMICLPMFLFALQINNYEKLYQMLLKASNIILALGVLLTIQIILNFTKFDYYNMSFSYYLLLPALVNLNEIINKYKINNIIKFLISLLIIISLGSRGALICIFVFFILKIIKSIQYENKLSSKLIIASFFVIAFFYKTILKIMLELSIEFGIESRTLKLLNGTGIELSNRDSLYDAVILALNNSPVFGIGISGDRRVLENIQPYVHNIFIELLANFGYVLGFGIIIVLLYSFFNTYLKTNGVKNDVLIFWFSYGFIHLLVSSSYLTDVKFWVFLGILINIQLNYNEIHRKNWKISNHNKIIH
jgi:hypothetical protein